MFRRLLRAPLTWVAVVALVVVAAFGLYWFQPWKLFTSTDVREELPVVAAPAPTSTPAGGETRTPQASGTTGAPATNVLLSAGDFITHEHATTGAVQLIRRTDGRLQLVLRNLATSDGPDLRVWLTDQPVRRGPSAWKVFDDGVWVELGRLKGNRGNQVYDVPAGTDLDQLRSVSIWCRRFSVSFGAAELRPA
jgi:hypothetical protein